MRIAVQSGTAQVVQVLLEHGAAEGFSPEQLTDLMQVAGSRNIGIAFRIIVQLLNCDRGASLPTTENGTLDPAMLQTLGEAVGLLQTSVTEMICRRRLFTSKKAAQNLMKDGLSQLIKIIFRQLPHQTAHGSVFGDILHVATVAGDLSTVRQLIKRNVDVNHIMHRLHSPLGTAVESGQIQVMKALIKAKASVHPDKDEDMHQIYGAQEPAVIAILRGQAPALKLLLDEGVDPNLYAGEKSLLLLAAENETPTMLKLLLQAGADPKASPLALVTAAHDGKSDMVRSLLDAGAHADALAIHGASPNDRHLCSPLYIACEKGHIDIVRNLLELGAHGDFDIGDRDGLPLVVAARHGHLDIVETLLESHCNPLHSSRGFEAIPANEKRKFRRALHERDIQLHAGARETRGDFDSAVPRGDLATDTDSRTEGNFYPNAIESACSGEKGIQTISKILKVLLKAVDDANERQEACLKAMQQVSETQHTRIFEELLEYLTLDSNALDLSCRCGSLKAVQKIVGHGISINATNKGGETPLQVAVDYGHSELIQYLVANGAYLEPSQDEGAPLDIYRLVAAVIESYAFSSPAKHKSITRCEEMVRKFLRIAHVLQMAITADHEFLNRSLILACHIGSVEMATCLLELGAKLDSLAHVPQHYPDYCPSPLFAAIEGNHPNTLPLLLQWDPDAEKGVERLASLDAGLRACLGKTSPVLLQTFLKYAGTFNISEQHLVLAAQKTKWARDPGETDLQMILEHRPDLTPSEEVLVTLLGIEKPFMVHDKRTMRHLYPFVLERSDCGITARMLRKVSDRDTWEVLHKYYQEHQASNRPTHSESMTSLRFSSEQDTENELQVVLQRIIESERRRPVCMTVGDYSRAGINILAPIPDSNY